MSIEALLAELRDELKANTAATLANSDYLAKHHELIGGLAGRMPGASAPKTDPANTAPGNNTPKTETAAEKKKRLKEEADAIAKQKAEDAKNNPAPTIESIRADVSAWLGTSANPSDELNEKRAAIARLLKHFGHERVTELPADKLVEFASFFNSVKDGEDPIPEPEAAAEEVDPLL